MSFSSTITIRPITATADVQRFISEDFASQFEPKTVQYQTPNGNFTVKVGITSSREEQVRLRVHDQFMLLLEMCPIHNQIAVALKPTSHREEDVTARFCAKQMTAEFSDNFADAETMTKVQQMIEQHNNYFSQEQMVHPTPSFTICGYTGADNQFHSFHSN